MEFRGFYQRVPTKLNRTGARDEKPVEYAVMDSGEDWLMRPVLEGLCGFESLRNGVLSLEDIAVMNDALDVRAENEARYRRAHADER